MDNPVLRVTGLVKRYGSVTALNGLGFEVMPGQIFALIGPNGAGKSTTLRILATILRPDEGDFFIDGVSGIDKPELIREKISYLAEESRPYVNMTGLEYLNFMASLYADSMNKRDEFVERAKKMCGLGERLSDKVKAYSKGMMRKLMIASSVMRSPVLAILDEPTSGLDVENAFYVRRQLKELKESGMSILLSSHNMLEIEYLADRVGIISKGVLLATGTPAELLKQYSADNLEQVFMEAANE